MTTDYQALLTKYPSPTYEAAIDIHSAVKRGLPADRSEVILGVPANVTKKEIGCYVYWDNSPHDTEVFLNDIATVHTFFIEVQIPLGRRDTQELEAEVMFHDNNILREIHNIPSPSFRRVMWEDVDTPLSGLTLKEPSRLREALQQRSGGDNSIRVPNIILPVLIDRGWNGG